MQASLLCVARSGMLDDASLQTLGQAIAFRRPFPTSTQPLAYPADDVELSHHKEVLRAVRARDITVLARTPTSLLQLASPDDGMTPLHVALLCKSMRSLCYLLKRGVPVNIRSHDGHTPLHLATSRPFYEAIPLLILHGANPTLIDNSAKDAFSTLRKTCSDETAVIVHRVLYGREHTEEVPVCEACMRNTALTYIPSCGHSFCSTCISGWIERKALEGVPQGSIRCLHASCGQGIHPTLVMRMVSNPRTLTLLEQSSLCTAFKTDKSARYYMCPVCSISGACFEPIVPDDATMIDVDTPTSPSRTHSGPGFVSGLANAVKSLIGLKDKVLMCGDIVCPNGHYYCGACGQTTHKGATCLQTAEANTLKWAESVTVNLCPNCGEYIEKNGGCDNMYCTACRKAFRWDQSVLVKANTTVAHNPTIQLSSVMLQFADEDMAVAKIDDGDVDDVEAGGVDESKTDYDGDGDGSDYTSEDVDAIDVKVSVVGDKATAPLMIDVDVTQAKTKTSVMAQLRHRLMTMVGLVKVGSGSVVVGDVEAPGVPLLRE